MTSYNIITPLPTLPTHENTQFRSVMNRNIAADLPILTQALFTPLKPVQNAAINAAIWNYFSITALFGTANGVSTGISPQSAMTTSFDGRSR